VTADLLQPGVLQTVRLTLGDDGVAWITLDRQDSANARNQQMRDELRRVYDFLATEARVLVLTGAGDRFFCAGMDLKESGRQETSLARRERLRSSRDIELLAALPLPTIAAINGYALGGGLEMALACDLRVVAEEAQVGLPEIAHGLVPGGGGTQRLPRLIGVSRTLELLYTSRRLSGREAVSLGVATECVPRAQLPATAGQLASRIAQQPGVALRTAKELVLRSLETPLHTGLELELDALLTLLEETARLGES